MTENDKYMRMAVGEAKNRLGRTEPNPAVGAVLVLNGTVLSRGFHYGAGHPHAEVESLKGVDEKKLKESTLYVTLEPCCHQGRTPPCTELLIKSGIKKVVYGMLDPNPLVAGKGVEKLRANNIEVEECAISEVNDLYVGYSYFHKNQRPFVTLKIALSKDWKMAGINGKRAKITCEETDKFTHQMRLESSAILTTANTVNADDPLLDCRFVSPEKKRVFIADRSKKLNKNLRIFQSASEVKVLNENVFEMLAKENLHTVWVEAGPRFSRALLESHSVNRFIVYESSVVLGEGVSFILEPEILSRFKLTRTFSSGSDIVKQWDLR